MVISIIAFNFCLLYITIMARVLLILAFLFSVSSVFSQKTLVKTILYFRSGKAIHTFLDRSCLSSPEKKIKCYASPNSDSITFYDFTEIDKIVLNEKEELVLWEGILDLSYIDKNSLDVKNEGKFIKDTVWLKTVSKGPVTLLSYKTDTKTHFFVRQNGITEFLLVHFRKVDHFYGQWGSNGRMPKYEIHPFYKDQLFKFFDWTAHNKIKNQIDAADYNEKDLRKIIEGINNVLSQSEK